MRTLASILLVYAGCLATGVQAASTNPYCFENPKLFEKPRCYHSKPECVEARNAYLDLTTEHCFKYVNKGDGYRSSACFSSMQACAVGRAAFKKNHSFYCFKPDSKEAPSCKPTLKECGLERDRWVQANTSVCFYYGKALGNRACFAGLKDCVDARASFQKTTKDTKISPCKVRMLVSPDSCEQYFMGDVSNCETGHQGKTSVCSAKADAQVEPAPAAAPPAAKVVPAPPSKTPAY